MTLYNLMRVIFPHDQTAPLSVTVLTDTSKQLGGTERPERGDLVPLASSSPSCRRVLVGVTVFLYGSLKRKVEEAVIRFYPLTRILGLLLSTICGS